MENLLCPLELAINFEVEGREYFLKAAKKVTHPFGKKVFEALAQDENRHIIRIRQIKEAMEKNTLHAVEIPMVSQSLKTVFKDAQRKIDKKVKPSESDLEAISYAMELEKKSNVFYMDLSKKTSDSKIKRFYEILADEEKGHYVLLQNTEEYLKSPADWFAGEERPIFEG